MNPASLILLLGAGVALFFFANKSRATVVDAPQTGIELPEINPPHPKVVMLGQGEVTVDMPPLPPDPGGGHYDPATNRWVGPPAVVAGSSDKPFNWRIVGGKWVKVS